LARTGVILSSGSPQRKAILEQLGVTFRVEVPELEEVVDGDPHRVVRENALLKARAVRGHTVLGADTAVVLDGQIFGKPADRHAAEALDRSTLDWYLDTDEWQGRAGGYAIQGKGAALVEAIEGDYFNVVGLPVPALLRLMPDLLRG
jgi:septum formation protein